MAIADEALDDKEARQKSLMNKLMLGLGIAAVIAVMVGFWLWSQQPDYKVLFSNYTDKDGGAIVAELEKNGVPYKFSEGGSAILIPSEQVHQTRLKMASVGLPKGGNVGFELLENQKFGVSQFVEQVNFHRGLEGELEKSIQAIESVANARVHLAIPKSTVFVRDKQKPTASVLLNLVGGRSLDERQVSAIVHLVASSVPDLPVANVTIVDQNGNLLSDTSKKESNKLLDATQLKYVEEMQQNIIDRIESIITPMVGEGNVHAQASAEVDFSTVEQADETYKQPNLAPQFSVVRSQQSSEMVNSNGGQNGGVPGALTNQPPDNNTAPIIQQAADATGAGAAGSAPTSSEKNSTTNYEVDKSVRYSQQSMGGIKRLTVAVIVNHKEVKGAKGKITKVPLTDAEKEEITKLARDAMGFKQDRGDSLSVVNSSFVDKKVEDVPETPIWKDPKTIDMSTNILKMLFGVIVLFILYKKAIKPMVRKLTTNEKVAIDDIDDGVTVQIGATPKVPVDLNKPRSYQQNLDSARTLAKENPKMVASLVTAWVGGNE